MGVADFKQFTKDYGILNVFATAHDIKTLLINVKSDLFMYADEPSQESAPGEAKASSPAPDAQSPTPKSPAPSFNRLSSVAMPTKPSADSTISKGRRGSVASLSNLDGNGPAGANDDEDVVTVKAELTYREFLELLTGLAAFVQRSPYVGHADKVDDFIVNHLQSKPLPKYHLRQM